MFSAPNMPSTTAVLSTYTTIAASALLVKTVLNEVQTMANQIVPQKLQQKIMAKLRDLTGNFQSQMAFVIDEYSNDGFTKNEVFEAAEFYLRGKIGPSVARIKVLKGPQEKEFSLSINNGEKIEDWFEGIQLVWEMVSVDVEKKNFDYDGYFSSEKAEKRSMELSFHKKYQEKVLTSYLPFLLETATSVKEEKKVVMLHSLGGAGGSVKLNHPSTFETLAMDPAIKRELVEDLDRFVRRRKFYKRVGKAWKRGYLLYGPPGTGKSSLIAAMANYLKFDVYDLELTSLHANSDFRCLLANTASRSIIVIEDIDCSSEFQSRQAGGFSNGGSQLFTLSGLLNFIDGLWSSCGDERIIVFTTNHKDKLDPALLRPGRMDKHIHMSYCTPSGFRILCSNYLGISNHPRFAKIEELITEVEATPAEIAEQLMKSEEADMAFESVVVLLERKKMEKEAAIDEGMKEANCDEGKEGQDQDQNQDQAVKEEAPKRARKNKRKSRRLRNRAYYA